MKSQFRPVAAIAAAALTVAVLANTAAAQNVNKPSKAQINPSQTTAEMPDWASSALGL